MPAIDHHAHFLPAGYRRAVADLGPGDPWAGTAAAFLARFGDDGSARPEIGDLAARGCVLDRAGVAVQLLSLGASTVWHEHEPTRRRLTDSFNDGVLEAITGMPGRFGLLASLPIPHVAAAVRDSERLAATPGVAGFGITSHPAGLPIDHPTWRPLLECWSHLGATVFVHPDPPASPLWESHWLRWGIGALVDDALVAARLVTSGILGTFAGIRWIVSHTGGGFALALGRLDAMWRDGRLPGSAVRPPSESLDGLWFDTALTDASALSAAAAGFGADRLIFGSDYPLGDVADVADARAAVTAALGTAARSVLARDLRGFRS